MSNPHLVFHHLGLAVKQPEPAKKFVATMGYQLGEIIFDPGQNVNSILCTHATQPTVEILWPSGTKGPIGGLVSRHPTGIIYHVCYQTQNLPAALAWLEATGNQLVCISSPKIAPLFSNRQVSFYNVIGMGLVEILS